MIKILVLLLVVFMHLLLNRQIFSFKHILHGLTNGLNLQAMYVATPRWHSWHTLYNIFMYIIYTNKTKFTTIFQWSSSHFTNQVVADLSKNVNAAPSRGPTQLGRIAVRCWNGVLRLGFIVNVNLPLLLSSSTSTLK